MKKSYEAMFLMDPALATDWPTAESEVKRILDRAEANVLGVKNWDERKLAYSMGPHKRGLYVLSFFEATAEKISGIERDVQLSEKTVRVLVLRRDRITAEQVEKALTAPPPPKTPVRGDEWSSRPPRFGGPEGRGPDAAVAVEVPDEMPDILDTAGA